MQKRTSLMVAYDILQIATGGSTKTRLVYKGNLNFRLIKKWLARLISKELIEFHPGPPKTWHTTPSGQTFILVMNDLLGIWDGGLIRLDEMAQEILG